MEKIGSFGETFVEKTPNHKKICAFGDECDEKPVPTKICLFGDECTETPPAATIGSFGEIREGALRLPEIHLFGGEPLGRMICKS